MIEAALQRVEGLLDSESGFMMMAQMMMRETSARRRRKVITVQRGSPLRSAIGPIVEATPDELRPGRLRMKYAGEEGEDGEGGGGVTRAFLAHAGGILADPQLGLLLPALGGHLQLAPYPGYLVPHSESDGSVMQQP